MDKHTHCSEREVIAQALCGADGNGFLQDCTDTQQRAYMIRADAVISVLPQRSADIVERLRPIANYTGLYKPHCQTILEAADEIERMRRVVSFCVERVTSDQPQAAPKLSDFAELKLLIDEYNPENSDWNFRRGVLLDILVRLWPTTVTPVEPQPSAGSAAEIFERCAKIAEVFGIGRESATYGGSDIATRIRADATDYLASHLPQGVRK